MDFMRCAFRCACRSSTSGGPVRRTDIVNLSNGRESRNSRWRDARRSYDAGSGIRSIGDLYEVLEFFEARAANSTDSGSAIRSTGNRGGRMSR